MDVCKLVENDEVQQSYKLQISQNLQNSTHEHKHRWEVVKEAIIESAKNIIGYKQKPKRGQ